MVDPGAITIESCTDGTWECSVCDTVGDTYFFTGKSLKEVLQSLLKKIKLVETERLNLGEETKC